MLFQPDSLSALELSPARRVAGFSPRCVVLTRGCLDYPMGEILLKRIRQVYPEIEVIDCQDRPHNRVEIDSPDSSDQGKTWRK